MTDEELEELQSRGRGLIVQRSYELAYRALLTVWVETADVAHWWPTRNSFLIGALGDVIEAWPDARTDFARRRDALAPTDGVVPEIGALRDWALMCGALGEVDRVRAWHATIARPPLPVRTIASEIVVPYLYEREDWAAAGRLLEVSPSSYRTVNHLMLSVDARMAAVPQLRESKIRYVVRSTTNILRALVAAKRLDDARAILAIAEELFAAHTVDGIDMLRALVPE